MSTKKIGISPEEILQVIIPRKGILELARLLSEGVQDVSIVIGTNHIQAKTENFTFTSKLVDGKFPDYDRVLPKGGNKLVIANRQELRQSLTRTAILSNEKFRGIRLLLSNNELKILANNPEQEEAEEIVTVNYIGDPLEIGFNVSYIIDVLSVLNTETVQITLSDPNSSALIEAVSTDIDEEQEPAGDDNDSTDDACEALYVIMPMRL